MVKSRLVFSPSGVVEVCIPTRGNDKGKWAEDGRYSRLQGTVQASTFFMAARGQFPG